jgi:hypothetical protein
MRTDISTRPRLARLGLTVASAVAFSASTVALVSAAPGEPTKRSGIYLVNKSNTKLNFELSNESKSNSWKPYSLAKGASDTYSNYRYIRIATGKGKMTVIKTYDISHSPHRYSLVWNKTHSCWDVFHEQTA